MMSSNKEKSTDDVMKKLKKERPDCSYLINSYCVFENNGVNQKSEKIKRIMRQCPEDDGMIEVHRESMVEEGNVSNEQQPDIPLQDHMGRRIQDDLERHASQMDRMFGSIFGNLFSGPSGHREDDDPRRRSRNVFPHHHHYDRNRDDDEFIPRSAPHHVPRGQYEGATSSSSSSRQQGGSWTQTSDPESV